MEPITHLLVGACISRAGLNRKTALATATLAISAEIGDLDVFYTFGGPVVGFSHHRGFTHTFLGVPLVAALTLAVVYGWNRLFRRPRARDPGAPVVSRRTGLPMRWGLLYGYACLGGVVHLLLDFTNNYGLRPFEPFSYKWYSWDIVFIVEPFMLLVLVLGLVMPSLFSLIQEEIGARRPGLRGRRGAIFALVCVVLMWGVRDFEHRRAVAALESRVYQGAEPIRVSAFPYPWNPFVWHGVVETENFFQTMAVNSLNGEVDPAGRARTRFKPEETPVTLAAKKSYIGRIYLDWAQYPVTEVEKNEIGEPTYTVRFYDLRFDYPGRSTRVLHASVDLDRNLNVVLQRFGRRVQR